MFYLSAPKGHLLCDKQNIYEGLPRAPSSLLSEQSGFIDAQNLRFLG